jgi:hypothetical protein
MHILIGVGVGLALLWTWLRGWWFARLIVFLGLAICGLFIGGSLSSAPGVPVLGNPAGILGGLLGVAVAWPLASLPTYYWRRQFRLALGAPFTPSRLRLLGYQTRTVWRQVIGPDPDNPTPSYWPAEAKDFTPSPREMFGIGVALGLSPLIILVIIAVGVALGQH